MALLGLILPLIVAIIALNKRKKYWKYSLAVSVLSIPILVFVINFYSHSTTGCQSGVEFCGFGALLVGLMVFIIDGLLAVVLAVV